MVQLKSNYIVNFNLSKNEVEYSIKKASHFLTTLYERGLIDGKNVTILKINTEAMFEIGQQIILSDINVNDSLEIFCNTLKSI